MIARRLLRLLFDAHTRHHGGQDLALQWGSRLGDVNTRWYQNRHHLLRHLLVGGLVQIVEIGGDRTLVWQVRLVANQRHDGGHQHGWRLALQEITKVFGQFDELLFHATRRFPRDFHVKLRPTARKKYNVIKCIFCSMQILTSKVSTGCLRFMWPDTTRWPSSLTRWLHVTAKKYFSLLVHVRVSSSKEFRACRSMKKNLWLRDDYNLTYSFPNGINSYVRVNAMVHRDERYHSYEAFQRPHFVSTFDFWLFTTEHEFQRNEPLVQIGSSFIVDFVALRPCVIELNWSTSCALIVQRSLITVCKFLHQKYRNCTNLSVKNRPTQKRSHRNWRIVRLISRLTDTFDRNGQRCASMLPYDCQCLITIRDSGDFFENWTRNRNSFVKNVLVLKEKKSQLRAHVPENLI